MMFLVHKGSDNAISIPGGYVNVHEHHVECGLRVVHSLLGIRLQRQNELHLRHSSTILLDCQNTIRHLTFQCEFWLEEIDSLTCSDGHTCNQLCKQFRKAHGLTYQLTNYKPDYSDDTTYGLLLDTDVVTNVVASKSLVYGFQLTTVSSCFDLWSLGASLSRVFPYKLNGTYFMNASCISNSNSLFPVPTTPHT